MRAVLLPEDSLPATLKLNPDLRMSDEEFFDFCVANRDLWLERTSEGAFIVSPPDGLEHCAPEPSCGCAVTRMGEVRRAW